MSEHREQLSRIYAYILRRTDEGDIPSVREICSEFGLSSTSVAHRYINELCQLGLIEKRSNCNRALRITGRSACSVPLIGVVTAGVPITAIENVEGYVQFPAKPGESEKLFALRVRGDSMKDAAILNDDIVIVRKSSYAENGDIVVALLGGSEATVKRFYKEENHYRLQPENPIYQPIICDELALLGKVVGVIRSY